MPREALRVLLEAQPLRWGYPEALPQVPQRVEGPVELKAAGGGPVGELEVAELEDAGEAAVEARGGADADGGLGAVLRGRRGGGGGRAGGRV